MRHFIWTLVSGSDGSAGDRRVISPQYSVLSLHRTRLNNPNPLVGLPAGLPQTGAGLRDSVLADLLSEIKLGEDTQTACRQSDALSARGGTDVMIEGQMDGYSELGGASESRGTDKSSCLSVKIEEIMSR